MKRFLALTLSCFIALNGSIVWGLDKSSIISNIDISKITTFNDVQKHWSKPYVTKLLATGIISGYDDGTFKPERTTTRGEFLRMLISALHEDPGVSKNGHWAKSYENIAIEKGYLIKGFDNLDKAITREEISILVSRSMKEVPSNLEEMKKVFNDYPEDVEITNHIAKVAGLGIIKGYDNGTFKPKNLATRAEVSTVLIRVLVPTERQIPKKIEKPIDKNAFIEPIFKVRHYTELSREYNIYHNSAIYIDNYKEYEYNESYQRKVECINVPELNEVDYLVWGDTKNYVRARMDNWLPIGRTFEASKGRIWALPTQFYTTQENMNKVKLYEGMELKFKISLKKGNVVKEYYQTVILEEVVKVN